MNTTRAGRSGMSSPTGGHFGDQRRARTHDVARRRRGRRGWYGRHPPPSPPPAPALSRHIEGTKKGMTMTTQPTLHTATTTALSRADGLPPIAREILDGAFAALE